MAQMTQSAMTQEMKKASPQISAPSSLPELHCQLGNVWGELAHLRESIGKLHERLIPIMSPIPAKETIPRPTPDGMSPVAEVIYRQSVSLAALTEQVNYLIDVLEV